MKLFHHLRELWRGPTADDLVPPDTEEVSLFEARRRELETKHLMSSQLSGNYVSAFLGQGLSFSELREYHAGDEPRLIHWGATARIGKPFVKLFREERQLRLIICLDITPSMMLTERKRKAIELASLFISIGQKNRDLIGLAPFASSLKILHPPANSRPHYRQLLLALHNITPHQERISLDVVSTHLRQNIKKRSVLIFLSDFEEMDSLEQFSILTRMHDVLCVHIPGAAEVKEHGLLRVMDPETGQTRLLDLSPASAAHDESRRTEEGHWQLARKQLLEAGASVVRHQRDALGTLDEITHRRRRQRH